MFKHRIFVLTLLVNIFLFWSTVSSAWTVTADFDSLANGSQCKPFWATNYATYVDSTHASSGSKSCKFHVNKGGVNIGGGFAFNNSGASYVRTGDELWIRFRIYMPAGYDYYAYGAGDHLKFILLTQHNDSSTTKGKLGWLWGHNNQIVTLERDNCTTDCNQSFGNARQPQTGTWETWEMYVKFDHTAVKDGGKGRVRAYKNGVLLADLIDRPTMWSVDGGASGVSSVKFFDYWNGGAPQTQDMWFDDLVITTDTPSGRDANGNPIIGVGTFVQVVQVAPPSPPNQVR